MANRLARWGSARLSRRVSKSLPWVGGAIAVAAIIGTMRRKGVLGGTFDTAVNRESLIANDESRIMNPLIP